MEKPINQNRDEILLVTNQTPENNAFLLDLHGIALSLNVTLRIRSLDKLIWNLISSIQKPLLVIIDLNGIETIKQVMSASEPMSRIEIPLLALDRAKKAVDIYHKGALTHWVCPSAGQNFTEVLSKSIRFGIQCTENQCAHGYQRQYR